MVTRTNKIGTWQILLITLQGSPHSNFILAGLHAFCLHCFPECNRHLPTASLVGFLLSAKVSQAFHWNKSQSFGFLFKVGECVVVSTLHRWCELRAGDSNRIAKFMPCFDSPFITNEPFAKNNNFLFPSWALQPPNPITVNSQQEFFIDKIVDEWMHTKKRLYQVCWQGKGPKGGLWLPAEKLMDCEVLDLWLSQKKTNPGVSYVHSYGPASSFSPRGFWHTCTETPFFFSPHLLLVYFWWWGRCKLITWSGPFLTTLGSYQTI